MLDKKGLLDILAKKLSKGGNMKRISIIFIISFLLISVFVIANEMMFIDFYELPTTLENYSHYDYMNGGYNGFPIRLQGDDIIGKGIYFTYMVQPIEGVRKQHWAFTKSKEPESLKTGMIYPENENHREGFGTLAIDPITGNPLFAWHSEPYILDHDPQYRGKLNSYFTWDRFFWLNSGGESFAEEPAVLLDNLNLDPTGKLKQEFIWPVVFFGPSPILGKSRVYVFMENIAESWQHSWTSYVPSSSAMLSFADIGYEDWDNLDDIVWTETLFEYLEKMHYWDNSKHYDYPFVRAYLSYTVATQPNIAGHVAIIGNIEGRTDLEWNDMLPPHNNVVIFSKDYGETFETMGFLLERRPDNAWLPILNPADVEAITDPEKRQFLLDDYESLISNTRAWRSIPIPLGMKTISFDSHGNLHFPSMYGVYYYLQEFHHEYLRASVSTQMISFNPNTQEIRINHIEPRVSKSMPDTIPWIFDLDDDGYIDINYLPNGYPTVYKYALPFYYHYVYIPPSYPWFYHNQMRLTEDNNGYMALMWMDSTKAHLNAIDSDFHPEFTDTPEIMISASIDSGMTWTMPFRLNYNEYPGSLLSLDPTNNSPSFIYPADRLIVLNRDAIRLYFMYNDNFGYGELGHGPLNGTAIRYTAVDLNIWYVDDDDEVIPVPENMLSQNFPNPFNPSTTIQFNIPRSGDVRLSIYNVKGQLVNTLVNEYLIAGQHSVVWEGRDNYGRDVASGIYFYRLETEGGVETKRMVLLK